MKKIAVFAGSTSKNSINKKLVKYAADLLEEVKYELLHIEDYPLPIYGVDLEETEGYPQSAKDFRATLEQYQGYIISIAEHNATYTVAFKNLLDWLSRINYNIWQNKPMLLLSASSGERGAANAIGLAKIFFEKTGAKIQGLFSLPSFDKNFKDGIIIDESLAFELEEQVCNFEGAFVKG